MHFFVFVALLRINFYIFHKQKNLKRKFRSACPDGLGTMMPEQTPENDTFMMLGQVRLIYLGQFICG